MSVSVLEQLVDHPMRIMKDGSLLSLNSLGNHYFPSSFGASFKGTLNVGPSVSMKWSPAPLIRPLAPGCQTTATHRSWFHRSSSGYWGKEWSFCVEEMCRG